MAVRDILDGVSWQGTYQGKPSNAAYCECEVLIISQDEDLKVGDAVSRRTCELIDDDKKQLEKLNISTSGQYDDASIMAARYALDKQCTAVDIERSKPLSKNKVLQLIRDTMKTSTKPTSK